MQERKLIFPSIILIIFSLISMNAVIAQPQPNKAGPYEACVGYAAPTVEFVCKDENLHFRAIDCDEVNEDTRECLSAECTITIDDDCSRIHDSYIYWSNNEPSCDLCKTIFAPVYDQ